MCKFWKLNNLLLNLLLDFLSIKFILPVLEVDFDLFVFCRDVLRNRVSKIPL